MTSSDDEFDHAKMIAAIAPEFADQQLNDKIGLHIVSASTERVIGTIPVRGNLQPYGLLHGGANAVLAESLGSIAAAINAGPGRVAVGLELSCTHHRAVREGTVTGVATPVHVGRGTITVEIVITDDKDRRSCTARLTCVTLQKPPG
ncbi:PaaI family thioesterase [Amycolatopsis suaedae]|uniref:Hotdog fold thioesterase n=1 Tax=Amycolatopsis suaedae TaxID=2510978 RepID=A0A4Q7J5Z5_9PSEU|nr:hotdog fold thioesterase [Amycolatopsis suaedae]